MRKASNIAIALLCAIALSCGGGGGSSNDTSTEADAAPDATDMVTETPADAAVDTPPVDAPVDVPAETAPDAEEDTVPDPDLDLPGDGSTACEEEGGYCTTYAVTSEPCVTCASVGGVDFLPAPGPDGTNECTATGEGAGAWCCLPVEAEPPECEASGGVCVPPGGVSDRCPVGWVEDTTGLACGGAHTCCVQGDSC
jgi:hypothetical protein